MDCNESVPALILLGFMQSYFKGKNGYSMKYLNEFKCAWYIAKYVHHLTPSDIYINREKTKKNANRQGRAKTLIKDERAPVIC